MLMTLLLLGLIGIPLGIALALILWRHIPAATVRWLAVIAAGSSVLLSLGLLPFAGQSPDLGLVWLPGAGTMRLILTESGLYGAAITAAAAAVAFGIAGPAENRPAITTATALVALSAANVVFLTAHFLARYVALEVVGLCIAVAALIEIGGLPGLSRGGFVYLILRLGDAALLTSIMVLGAATDTFEIAPALAGGAQLSQARLTLVVVGFLLAVAVKAGIWPFQAWIWSGEALSSSSYAWLYATLMPNLGLYLLYRTAPLIAVTPSLQTGVFWSGVAFTLLAGVSVVWRPDRARLPARVGAILGGLMLCIAALGVGDYVWWGLLLLTPVRVAMALWGAHRYPHVQAAASITSPMQRQMERLIQRLYTDVEIGTLDHGTTQIADGTVAFADWLYSVVEQQGLEGAVQGVVTLALKGSMRLRHWHTGRLRANMRWVVVSLVLVVAALLIA